MHTHKDKYDSARIGGYVHLKTPKRHARVRTRQGVTDEQYIECLLCRVSLDLEVFVNNL